MAWEHDIAWLAGFLDGEGCFRITQTRRGGNTIYAPAISVTQKSKLPLLKIVRLTGGQITRDSRGYWRWHWCSSPEIEERLPDVIPHLTLKKKQAELLLKFCGTRTTRGVNHDKQTRSRRTQMYEQMKGLK